MSTAEGQLRADTPAAVAVYNRALRDLGPDLGGFSLVDLLADNFPWPLDYCRAMAARLRELQQQAFVDAYCMAELVEEARANGDLP